MTISRFFVPALFVIACSACEMPRGDADDTVLLPIAGQAEQQNAATRLDETPLSAALDGVDPQLSVEPTRFFVLGTPHLSAYDDKLSAVDLEPLLARLATFAPDIITTENSAGMVCQRVRAYPDEHEGYADSYCFDGALHRNESGLELAEASVAARRTLLEWGGDPNAARSPAQRRRLAAAFLASEEPASALVQWLRLTPDERKEGDGLGPQSVKELGRLASSMNESYSVASALAARLGLERVYSADDHGSYLMSAEDRTAYGARLSELWSGSGEVCETQRSRGNAELTGDSTNGVVQDIIAAYRIYNSKDWQRQQMDCDWRRAMNDAAPEGYGRRYVHGWQARNLRMVGHIMTAAADRPGGKVLSIVGASHKPYFEAYLDRMHDVEVVPTELVLTK